MQNARSEGRQRGSSGEAPQLRLVIPPDADRRAREALRSACGLCADDMRERTARLRAALRAHDAGAAMAEAVTMRALVADFHLHGLSAPVAQIERLLREGRGPLAALAPLATLEARLEGELAALPA